MNRYKFLSYFLFLFLAISMSTRVILLADTYTFADHSLLSLAKLFVTGLFYDIVAFFYFMIPFVIYLFLIPQKIYNAKIHKVIALVFFFLVIYAVIFNGFSEWFFWEEFGKRFNFIAVDYLVYTHEVIHNILESYPIPLLLTLILLLTSGVFWLLHKRSGGFSTLFTDNSTYKQRLPITLLLLTIPILSFAILDKQHIATETSPNRYNQELAKNGFYALFSAFRNNELDYYAFYQTINDTKMLENYRKLVQGNDSRFLSKDLNQTLRVVKNGDEEKRYNVILVMIESLSAAYMDIYGNDQNLTPHMDALTKKSLFFSNLFATGTRTVRGMEAVTMSVPPTPGRSIVKRPDNHNMFGIGWIFKSRGYDNKFIYAGHGYFDNMNEYFSHNGFKIVDRYHFAEDEITFANVWGVCDEDLFNKTIREADRSYEHKKPFFSFVMTTSNHRPYTYPEGKIDIPSHTGRSGGVKYTDYAVDQFLKKAATKPWFENTIFIFVADHNGGSAGKADLPLYRYKIPLIIYAPKLIKPQNITKLASQIDVAPTLLGILGWNYKSKFYGQNILRQSFKPRALIGSYQKLGLYRNDRLTILTPDKKIETYSVERLGLKENSYKKSDTKANEKEDIITYYQSASYFYRHRLDRY
jgi:phosphoglycerol transferase MdoB-like AlkP superfamily enzyme